MAASELRKWLYKEHIFFNSSFHTLWIIGDHKTNTPAIIPVCKTTWYNGIKEGRYPKPVKISKSSVAWQVDHIRQLVEEMAGAA